MTYFGEEPLQAVRQEHALSAIYFSKAFKRVRGKEPKAVYFLDTQRETVEAVGYFSWEGFSAPPLGAPLEGAVGKGNKPLPRADFLALLSEDRETVYLTVSTGMVRLLRQNMPDLDGEFFQAVSGRLLTCKELPFKEYVNPITY